MHPELKTSKPLNDQGWKVKFTPIADAKMRWEFCLFFWDLKMHQDKVAHQDNVQCNFMQIEINQNVQCWKDFCLLTVIPVAQLICNSDHRFKFKCQSKRKQLEARSGKGCVLNCAKLGPFSGTFFALFTFQLKSNPVCLPASLLCN